MLDSRAVKETYASFAIIIRGANKFLNEKSRMLGKIQVNKKTKRIKVKVEILMQQIRRKI